jgi:hypothetical protein
VEVELAPGITLLLYTDGITGIVNGLPSGSAESPVINFYESCGAMVGRVPKIRRNIKGGYNLTTNKSGPRINSGLPTTGSWLGAQY